MSQSENEFVSTVQHCLSTSLDDIDENVLLRLKLARSHAIQIAIQQKEKNDDTNHIQFPTWLAPASTIAAFATIAFVTATILIQPSSLNLPISSASLIEDIALLGGSDELELYENLDFYIWLANDDTKS